MKVICESMTVICELSNLFVNLVPYFCIVKCLCLTLLGHRTWAMCVCMYVCGGQSEEAGGGHEHRETIPWLFSTSVMVYFTCRQGHGTDGLTSPPKDS